MYERISAARARPLVPEYFTKTLSSLIDQLSDSLKTKLIDGDRNFAAHGMVKLIYTCSKLGAMPFQVLQAIFDALWRLGLKVADGSVESFKRQLAAYESMLMSLPNPRFVGACGEKDVHISLGSESFVEDKQKAVEQMLAIYKEDNADIARYMDLLTLEGAFRMVV